MNKIEWLQTYKMYIEFDLNELRKVYKEKGHFECWFRLCLFERTSWGDLYNFAEQYFGEVPNEVEYIVNCLKRLKERLERKDPSVINGFDL